MEAVFSTTSRHSSFPAVPGRSERRAIPCAAFMPMGVAALPRPRKLAETFAASASSVSVSCEARGKSLPSAGRSSLDSADMTPERRMTSMTPHHRQIRPPVPIITCTAAGAPSSAARPVSAPFPLSAPHTMDTTRAAAHILDILFIPPN